MGILVGCGRNGSGGGGDQPEGTGTGRSDGRHGDVGGNGKVYDRGGPPGSPNPSSQQPGSGRIDQGGGKTAGGPIDNSVPTTNSPRSGPSGYR